MVKPSSKLVVAILVTILLSLSAFVRLYRIESTHTFHNDEGRDVLIALKMIESRRPILLGPQTSTGNMYLGPLYYYLMVPSLLISGLDPVGPAVMVAVFGVLTTLLIYILARSKIGDAGAFVAALVFALQPVIVNFTRNSWNPNVVPFFALLTLYLGFSLGVRVSSRKRWLAFGVLAGILIQLHYVAALIVILLWLTIFIENRAKLLVIGRGTLIAAIGFFISTFPFWLFEMRHNWVNTLALFSYLGAQGSPSESSYFLKLWQNIKDFTDTLVATKANNPSVIPLYLRISFWLEVLVLALAAKTFQKPKQQHALTLIFITISSILIYSLLNQKLEIHYLAYIFPVYAYIFGYGVSSKQLWAKATSLVLTLVILSYNIPILAANLQVAPSHQVEKAQTVAQYIELDAGGQNYNVVPGFNNSRDATYGYFLALLENKPHNSPENLVYMICEDTPCEESMVNSPLIFARGSVHPAVEEYSGHPFILEYTAPRRMVSLEHVAYGTWVAKIYLEP